MDSPEIIFDHFPGLSDKQRSQFAQLGPLYEEWNAKINVISRKDMDHFYERHVLHSLGIAKVMEFSKGSLVLDVGTGGGFPGIPLAIMFPEVEFDLVDSIGKKIKVVNAVAEALGLNNVDATAMRAEQASEKYDFVVSRAVTRMKPFLQWIRTKIATYQDNPLPNGVLYLKGGDLTQELREVKRPTKVYDLSDYFQSDFFETKKVVHVAL